MRVHDVEVFVPTQSPIPLTPQGQQLLDLLHEIGDWVNRTELARRVAKSALNKWDLVLLNKLVDAGMVEARQIPRHGPIGYEWQYRAVQLD